MFLKEVYPTSAKRALPAKCICNFGAIMDVAVQQPRELLRINNEFQMEANTRDRRYGKTLA